jgi:CopG family nickel-responsive transcriptional regulator
VYVEGLRNGLGAAAALYNCRGGVIVSHEPSHGTRSAMGDLSRIGVSLDSELLDRFDRFIAKKGYENRSEAFRDLIRDRLVDSTVITPSAPVVGTITLIYDHHTRLLSEKLTELQHQSHEVIISTLHAHLDHETCLEVIVLRGKSREVQALADRLISTKGVQHGRLVMSSAEIVAHSHPHS